MYKYNWNKFSVNQIIGGKTADGLRYLELFLKDYSQEFNTRVNPGCSKCIATYLNNYKQRHRDMSKCKYVLKKKYNGIQTKFGSGIFVTNDNITDALGAEIFKNHPNPTQLFETYPKETTTEKAIEEKPKRKRRNSKK